MGVIFLSLLILHSCLCFSCSYMVFQSSLTPKDANKPSTVIPSLTIISGIQRRQSLMLLPLSQHISYGLGK